MTNVPDLDGYVWFGSNEPLRDGGYYIGCTPASDGWCIEIVPQPAGAHLIESRIFTPETTPWPEVHSGPVSQQWALLLIDAGIPSGGLASGTPRAVVLDALARGGYKEASRAIDLYGNGGDISALTKGLQRLVRAEPVQPGPEIPADVVNAYRISAN